MRKILSTYYSFVIASLVVIVVFMTATTYTQLAIAILLYPLFVYFAFKAFPRKTRKHPPEKPVTATIQPPVAKSAEKVEVAKRENVSIADIDKRAFLKLIGGVGLSLFLLSIFNKKAEAVLFKSLPDPSGLSLKNIVGDKIDPAQNHPTDGYYISEIDDDTVSFYGFINRDSRWYIMRTDSDNGSFRYTRGESKFIDNWNNRQNLKYDYFSNVFR